MEIVPNIITGKIYPKYHVVFDDSIYTVDKKEGNGNSPANLEEIGRGSLIDIYAWKYTLEKSGILMNI